MRRIVWIGTIVALLWAGWWWLLSYGVERGVQSALDAQRSQGWDATLAGSAKGGFPFASRTRLTDLALRDPAMGSAVTASEGWVTLPSHWPGRITIDLPEVQFSLPAPIRPMEGQANGVQAYLNLRPGFALELEEISAQSGPWQLLAERGDPLTGQGLVAFAKQHAADPNRYRLRFEIPDLTPGTMSRALFDLSTDWPDAFETLGLDIRVTFDRPWDRTVADGATPQPRQIDVDQAEVAWGPLRLAVAGSVAVAADGTPEGTLRLRIEEWEQLLDMAERSGALPAEMRQRAQTFFLLLSRFHTGDPSDLDLDVHFRDAKLFLETIELGPAPKFVIPAPL